MGPSKTGRADALHAQAGDDRVRLPVTKRRVISQSDAARAAPIAAQQVGRDPRFIEEHVVARIAERQHVLPSATRGRHVRSALFVGVYRFF